MVALSKVLKDLMKFHNETSQMESDPEVIPYAPWVIYENQFFTGLLSIN